MLQFNVFKSTRVRRALLPGRADPFTSASLKKEDDTYRDPFIIWAYLPSLTTKFIIDSRDLNCI